MTFQELLKSCSEGEFPTVQYIGEIRFAKSNIGKVNTVKENGRHKGCAVTFEGLNYSTWFSDSEETDKRTKYMRDLILYKTKEVPHGND